MHDVHRLDHSTRMALDHKRGSMRRHFDRTNGIRGLVLVAAVAGCKSDDREEAGASGDDAGTGITSLSAGDGEDGTLSDEGTLGGEGSLKLDVDPQGDGTAGADSDGPVTGKGCKKVDVIISVDNSSSMTEEVAAFQGPVFESFPQALLSVGAGLENFHLAVIDACNNLPFFHDHGQGGFCNYTTGRNFMVSTSSTMPVEYRCVTSLTQSGYQRMEDRCSGENDDEQPGNTAADAVSLPARDQQNADFLRDDALLFVIAITDEDEQPVPRASAQEIVDKFVAAKQDIKNVVFLGIGGASDCDGLYGSADDARFLQELTGVFAAANRGLFWDLCGGSLADGVLTALELVDSACIDFDPTPQE